MVAPWTFNSLMSSLTNTGELPSLTTVSANADIITTAAPSLGAVIAASRQGHWPRGNCAHRDCAAVRVDDGDFDRCAVVGHIAENLVEAEAFTTDVALIPNLRVDRQEIALPAGLDSKTAEEYQGGRTRFDFSVEAVERCPHRLLAEIFRDRDVETLIAQLRAERAGVADRLLQWRTTPPGFGIGRVRQYRATPPLAIAPGTAAAARRKSAKTN